MDGGANLFAYVENNPVNRLDFLGLQSTPVPFPLFPPIFGPKTPEQKAADKDIANRLWKWMKKLTNNGCKNDEPCPPCKLVDGTEVPVGTVAYRWDKLPSDVEQHGIKGEHLNLYKANQNPNNCRCFWSRIGTVKPPPQPGWIPIQNFAN